VDWPLKKINCTDMSHVTELPKRSGRCSHESALHIYKNPYEVEKIDILRSSFWRIAKHDLRLKIYKRLSGLL